MWSNQRVRPATPKGAQLGFFAQIYGSTLEEHASLEVAAFGTTRLVYSPLQGVTWGKTQ